MYPSYLQYRQAEMMHEGQGLECLSFMDITQTEVLYFNSSKRFSVDAETVSFNWERHFELVIGLLFLSSLNVKYELSLFFSQKDYQEAKAFHGLSG